MYTHPTTKLSSAVAVVAILMAAGCVPAQQVRGVGVRVRTATGQTTETRLYEGSYALLIGNSEYSAGWERLSGVKGDVVAVRDVLQRHGFKVEVEENLTSEHLLRRVRKFINDYGLDRDNRLIIYYAGHGYTLGSAGDKRELGYVIPSDTPLPTRDERGFRQKAVSMYTIQNFAKEIQAKHALFVFDSCFSGRLFALRDTLKITPFIVEKVNYPVRQFITAGDETQTVPDESIFRKAFVRGLEGEANRNKDEYITGTELAEYLKESVTNYTNRRLTPQYGTINDIELDRGDIVFAVPGGPAAYAASQPSAPPRVDAATVEKEYWAEIKSSTDVEDFRLYKQNYPNGIYRTLADLKIRQLTRAAARPAGTPNPTVNNTANPLVVIDDIELESFQADNGKSGYKNKKGGAVIIAPIYDKAYPFYGDLANVVLNEKQGYVNKRGEVIIPLIYDYVPLAFSEGLATVKLDGKYGVIDKTGRVIISFKYEDAGSFFEGLARVELGGKWGYIDRAGQVVIPFKYEETWPFDGGKAKVMLDGKVGIIDKTEKILFPFKYEDIGEFRENLMKVKLNGKWGFIDDQHNLVIPYKYDDVFSFYDGLADVVLDGKQGYIDKAGNVVIPIKYDNVSAYFEEGLSWVKLDKKYGFIDKTDKLVIPIKYDEANGFSGGKAKVKLGEREFYIDREGNEVAAP